MYLKWVKNQKEVFSIERSLLRICAMWPGDDLINFKFLLVYCLNIFFVFLPLCFYFAFDDDEIFEVLMGLCELIQTIVYNVKMLCVLYRRKELKHLIESISNSFKALEKSSDPALKQFHVEVIERSAYIILIYLLIVPGALTIYFYAPLIADCIKLLQGRDDLKYPLVLKANYVIFNPRENNVIFVIYTFISRFYINYFLMEFYLMDFFIMMLLFYVACVMESVKLKLKLFSIDSTAQIMNEHEAIERMKQIVDDHKTAIWMIKTLDAIVRNMMLAQFILFSVSFCFVMFNFYLLLDNYFLLLIVSIFVVVTQLEQFVFCYLITMIQDEVCHLVGFQAYDINFYDCSPKLCKMISFIIMRSQDKKVTITAGKFYASDIQRFGAALQSSVGYYALIKSVYVKSY